VKKLVLFNAHGGQVGAMDLVARDLRARLGMLVYSVSWFNLPLRDADGQDVNALFSAEEHRFGIHGGDVETSMMLALAPQRVRMAQAEYFRSTSQDRAERFPILGNGKSAKLGWQMQDYNANGAVGNAAAATADKGRALRDAASRALAQLLSEIDQLPPDTLGDKTALIGGAERIGHACGARDPTQGTRGTGCAGPLGASPLGEVASAAQGLTRRSPSPQNPAHPGAAGCCRSAGCGVWG
jgi:hypothetical protein